MGNVLQISCDGAIFNRCLHCFLGKAAYIRSLQENVVSLETELATLIAKKNDLMTRVRIAERQQMRRLDQVQVWLSRVDAAKAEADELIRHGSQEIEKLCLGGYCSTNCKSSYEFGKQVAKKVNDVKTLTGEGVFDVVAERPTEPTVVGLQSQLEHVWRCLVEEPVGIIGLYGMGGVGKTTLMTHINNKFLGQSDVDFVIWVVVSKDIQIEKIQEIIGKKVGLFNDSRMENDLQERALDIFNVLKGKKFVLFLDDIWQRVDLTKVGVPLPGPLNNASKVVFTTRSEEVCGLMEAHKKIKVVCLPDIDAWELFRQKVGEETLNCHPHILELAQKVANECGGLPLALITIGRAMASKKTPEEWSYAIQVLRTSSSQFPGLGNEIYPLLKFSYDNLPNDTIRSCLLYCTLYSEDFLISKENLIDCWIGEGFLNESNEFGVQNQGYYILGILVHACLLEEVEEDDVKMHDVIRDMALWLACDVEKEKESYLVYAGAGLSEAPDVRKWEKARRLSLMENQIENLSAVPACPYLLTLFLNNNKPLERIPSDFFQSMPRLKVLNLSHARQLHSTDLGISKLVSLQHLDLSFTCIPELPKGLNALVNLKCLNLENVRNVTVIPGGLISSFPSLHVFRIFGIGYASSDPIIREAALEELHGLKYLEVLSLTLRDSGALQCVSTSHKLRSCTQALSLKFFPYSKSLDASVLAELKHLSRLRIAGCWILKELKMDYTGVVQNTRQHFVFHSLKKIEIENCSKLMDLTFLTFAPNLKSIDASFCRNMQEIVRDVPELMQNLNLFAKLRYLSLSDLPMLMIIYSKALPFPHLKEMTVIRCDRLEKLPLDSNSAKERKIVIRGYREWWERIQWEDQATQNAFLPCFQSIHGRWWKLRPI